MTDTTKNNEQRTTNDNPRCILLVLDSVGIGEAPDASDYGDEGSNTLAHLAEAGGGIHLPTLQAMGLGNIPSLLPTGLPIQGVPPTEQPTASYGAMQEASQGKGTTTGHWEMAGLLLEEGFKVFPPEHPSFPPELIQEFERRTERTVICNHAASGTQIIQELGEQQMKEGAWIVYTSADSVFQIAAHEKVIPLDELYKACEIARELCNPYHIGRVIARPYIGEKPGDFARTDNRHDYSYPLPEPTILDRLSAVGHPVTTVGKLDDIFNNSGITGKAHAENTPDAMAAMLELIETQSEGLIFANFIDFDMLYGHRRDAAGYARALEDTDKFLFDFLPKLGMNDTLIITADHGNDPTFRGTDHTREYVPLLSFSPSRIPLDLGIRHGFYDIAQSLASLFSLKPLPRGVAFL